MRLFTEFLQKHGFKVVSISHLLSFTQITRKRELHKKFNLVKIRISFRILSCTKYHLLK